MADYYAILGISHASETDEIAKAYRRAALTYNPSIQRSGSDDDRSQHNREELARRFNLVSQAYVVLSDAKTRAIYDMYGESGVKHGGTFDGRKGLAVQDIDADEVFRKFFGVDNPFQVIGSISGIHSTQHHFFSEVAAAKAAEVPPPVLCTIQASLEDVFTGVSKNVKFQPKAASETEKTISVQIPKGSREGAVIHANSAQGPVDVTVELEKHDMYTREADNLCVVMPITLADALTGTTVSVRLIDGRMHKLLVDEVVHPDFSISLAGEGLPNAETGKRGDMIVRFATQFPKYLSADQKRELRRVLSE